MTPRSGTFPIARPITRGDCERVARPCPHGACRYHLAKDRERALRRTKLVVIDDRDSCALDVADRGPSTLAEVGAIIGVTRERTRQLEDVALARLQGRLPHAAFAHAEGWDE